MKKALFTVLWMLVLLAGGILTFVHDVNSPEIQHNAVVAGILGWLYAIALAIAALSLGIRGRLPGTRYSLFRAQALAIARRAAAEHKVALRKYQRPVVTFMSEFGQWSIFWPNPASTECFEVLIDDKTAKIVSAKEVPIYQTMHEHEAAA